MSSSPKPNLRVGNPTTLATGESAWLLTGDHPFMNIPGKFAYTAIALSNTRFDLRAHVEYTDGYTEIIRSAVRARSSRGNHSVDDAVVHVGYYDWVNPTTPFEHEEIVHMQFHRGIKRIALVLHTPERGDTPGERQFAVHVMSGTQVSVQTAARRHYLVGATEPSPEPGGNRHLMAVLHHGSALRLDAPGLCSADPNARLCFVDDAAMFC